jgi:hypothetical protein
MKWQRKTISTLCHLASRELRSLMRLLKGPLPLNERLTVPVIAWTAAAKDGSSRGTSSTDTGETFRRC